MSRPKPAPKTRDLGPAELLAVELGTQLKDFLATEAGRWLKTRLSEGQNAIAVEALLNPSKECTLDYYRGRASELSSLSHDIEERISAAEAIMAEPDEDPFESYDGPEIGGGASAIGDFGR